MGTFVHMFTCSLMRIFQNWMVVCVCYRWKIKPWFLNILLKSVLLKSTSAVSPICNTDYDRVKDFKAHSSCLLSFGTKSSYTASRSQQWTRRHKFIRKLSTILRRDCKLHLNLFLRMENNSFNMENIFTRIIFFELLVSGLTHCFVCLSF